MKKILPILAIVVVAAGALVAASMFILPSGMPIEAGNTPIPAQIPTARPAEVSARPTPTPTPDPTPTPEPTPEPTPAPPGMPTATPKPDLPVATVPEIDESETGSAVISVRYSSSRKLKVIMAKGEVQYTHDMTGDNYYVRYPLNMGTGSYSLTVYENVGGTAYVPVSAFSFTGHWDDPNTPYLQSVQSIRWDESMKPIYDAMLIQMQSGDAAWEEIYHELADTLAYDWYVYENKTLPKGYLPEIERTYETRLGICYDFSALFASMLRSVGIPAKLVHGNASAINGRHAWNEVYVGGQWMVYDLTVDAIYREWGNPYGTAQPAGDYAGDRQY